jgi:acyl-homoserine lactone acylase PvdQ
MFRNLLTAAAGLALIASAVAPVMAAPCRDAQGKFAKCPPAAATVAVTKDAKGKCHVATGPKKGQFTKCP